MALSTPSSKDEQESENSASGKKNPLLERVEIGS